MDKLIVRKFGLFGAVLVILFYIVFLVLGSLQPGYIFSRDTVSELVNGKYGWVQTINFFGLILSVSLIVYSLKQTLIKNKLISKVFYIILVELFFVLVFPIGETFLGTIHYIITFLLILSISVLMLLMIEDMKKSILWKSSIPYFIFVLLFNLIFWLLWFVFDHFQLLVEWRGLFQKIIILNMISWISITGFKLWCIE